MMMNKLAELMDFYKGKKVFVTGDTGFKGTWLCKLLTMAQAEVTGYALPPASREAAEVLHRSGVAERIRHVDGDVRDYATLHKAFEAAAPEIVFHLAAQPLVLKSYDNPLETPELSGCYNIGPDDTDCTTTEKLVQLFCRAWGDGATWRWINAVQPHEANFLKLDCSRIKAVLGWQPHWHIEEAVQHTVAWAKAYYAGDNIAGLMEGQIREFGFGEVDNV